jgi:hypothetical protein
MITPSLLDVKLDGTPIHYNNSKGHLILNYAEKNIYGLEFKITTLAASNKTVDKKIGRFNNKLFSLEEMEKIIKKTEELKPKIEKSIKDTKRDIATLEDNFNYAKKLLESIINGDQIKYFDTKDKFRDSLEFHRTQKYLTIPNKTSFDRDDIILSKEIPDILKFFVENKLKSYNMLLLFYTDLLKATNINTYPTIIGSKRVINE